MPSTRPALALLLALLAAPAATLAAQSNTARVANDAYTRSHDYDLVHQRITLGDFDWDSTSFTGSVATTLVALRPAFDTVVLDAGALLHVDRVRDARGAPLRWDAHGDTLLVLLARPVGFRDTVRFTIDYHGRVRSGHGLTFIRGDGRPDRPRQIWSQGEDDDNHFWFPTYDFPNDKMTWDMVVTVPRGYTAVSNGTLVSDRPGPSGTRTFIWSQRSPASTYLVSLIVAPLVRIHDAWHGVPVDYYVYRQDSALARRTFRPTPDMIDVYSRLTGVPYPWAKYAQTTVADFFGGMENVSATTLVDWLPDGRAFADRPWYQWILIPHELAHQWFGDYVTTMNWANTWLNEGFAEFMPGQYWQERLGRHAADDYYLDEYRQFTAIDARRRMPLAALGSNNIYPKGALVLRMLQHVLGPQPFWASLHTYLTRHPTGNATTDDLRQAVLLATGQNLDWFWQEWIYDAGYPAFEVAAAYDSANARLTLSVAQTQTDTGTADSTGLRYTTPLVFRMPVTIRVGTVHGDVVHTAQLSAREQSIVIDSVTSPPTMVVFDDGNRILKHLEFDEPTAWLATQLARDPDLWDRWWVIGRLAARTTDPDAGAALAAAAAGADYDLTRAEAAEALGQFPAAVAQSALAAAVRDTSSRVRAAALHALGDLGGDQALASARDAFAHDTSYDVRAAALGVVTRLDAAGRRAAIAEGLATPSYRDVIQNAALGAIYQSGDTTFVAALDSMFDKQIAVPLTLGALAARGSGSALDVLARHLDDAYAPARQWAVLAFQYRVPVRIALPRLQQVQPNLRYDDTKDAVGRLVSTLEKSTPAS